MLTTRRVALGMMLAAATSAPAVAADWIADALAIRVDQQRRGTKAIVGVISPDGRRFVARGMVDANGVFEVASLTKVFTALLLSDAVRRGEVRLDDPLSAFEPEAPSFDGQTPTLMDLAVHGAGLPLRPPNLQETHRTFDRYAGYTLQQLRSSLKGYALLRRPGERFEYSNWGYGLLGDALARRSRLSYPDLLKERVVSPIGLDSTAIVPDTRMRKRLIQGHDDRLRPLPPTSDGALAPAGGLKSTARDLLSFVSLFLGQGPSDLVTSAAAMLAVDRPGDDQVTRVVLGWRKSAGSLGPYYWSNGRADGHRAFMGFNPKTATGVVALIDAGGGPGVDDIGRRLLDPQSPVDLKPRIFHVETPMSAVQMDRYVGTFQYAPEDQMVLSRDGDMLVCQVGASRLEVRSMGDGRFFFPDVDGALLAFRPDRSAVELRQDGQVYVYLRVAGSSAPPS